MIKDYDAWLKEIQDSMSEEQKDNIARIKRNIEENNRMLEAEYNKPNPSHDDKSVNGHIVNISINKPWYKKHTRAEREKKE